MSENNSKTVTIVNNSDGIRQYVWRKYVTKKSGRVEARSEIVRLKPGANAGVSAEAWANLDKVGLAARADQDDNVIVPLETHIDKMAIKSLVELIKGLTCIDTARIWLDESRKPQVKDVLSARIRQMDHLEEAKPEDLLKKGA